MLIDYFAASEKYRPELIQTLLVGEAPPPNGRSYFYVPCVLRRTKAIEHNRSLPATIFHHYFAELPSTAEQYDQRLRELAAMNVFLMDLLPEPVRVRGSAEGLQRVKDAIPQFRNRLSDRRIEVREERMVFLLARKDYLPDLRREFPTSKFIPWIKFRIPSRR